MEITETKRKLFKIAREQFRQEIKFMDKHNYHCGVRFYSDKMLCDKK